MPFKVMSTALASCDIPAQCEAKDEKYTTIYEISQNHTNHMINAAVSAMMCTGIQHYIDIVAYRPAEPLPQIV